ncbi:MAG: zonular occludens toxin domain-containing protein [Neglectibacter timonensis]|jgi:hypothetical protein
MKILLTILETFFTLLKLPLMIFGGMLLLLGLCCLIYGIRAYRSGARLKKGEHIRVPKPPLWKNLLYYLPKQMVADYFAHDPEFFRYQGCIVFTGRQGYGKTIAMAEQALRWRKEYPKAKCITNFALRDESAKLNDWRLLVGYKNGIQGVIACIDEMQNWFSSNQSKNFPPEMLEVITQNRKNRRVIMGTAQSFNRLAKPIREQATEVRKCYTFFGCLTFVHRVYPELDSNGDVDSWKHRGWYYFVHNAELRESYDTWKVIESLKESGFQEQRNTE